MSENEHDHDTCRELLSTLGEYVDGSLSADLCTILEQHMNGCHRCRVVVNSLKRTVELYQENAEEVDLPDNVRERLYQCLDLDEFLKKP